MLFLELRSKWCPTQKRKAFQLMSFLSRSKTIGAAVFDYYLHENICEKVKSETASLHIHPFIKVWQNWFALYKPYLFYHQAIIDWLDGGGELTDYQDYFRRCTSQAISLLLSRSKTSRHVYSLLEILKYYCHSCCQEVRSLIIHFVVFEAFLNFRLLYRMTLRQRS